MAPPAAQANGTTGVKTIDRHKDFEAITITGYYTRDIRFPVFHIPIAEVNFSDRSNRPLCRMRDLMP